MRKKQGWISPHYYASVRTVAEDVLPLAMWKYLFLCLLSGSEQEELNTSACLSSLRPHCRQTRTWCRQEKSIITPLCVTVYHSHSVTLSLTDPSLQARVHVRTHSSTLTVCFHSCFQCPASLVCVRLCVCMFHTDSAEVCPQ